MKLTVGLYYVITTLFDAQQNNETIHHVDCLTVV